MSILITLSQSLLQRLPHAPVNAQTSIRASGNVAMVPAEQSRWSQNWGWEKLTDLVEMLAGMEGAPEIGGNSRK